MSESDFLPQVWTAEGVEPVLVCGRRWARGGKVIRLAREAGEVGGARETFTIIVHPVVIYPKPLTGMSGTAPTIGYYFTGRPEGVIWTAERPEDYGISSMCAGLALREAWRTVKFTIDHATFSGSVKANTKKLMDRDGAIFRFIGVFMRWDHWNRERVSLEDRLAETGTWGVSAMTRDAMRRLMEKTGIEAKT